MKKRILLIGTLFFAAMLAPQALAFDISALNPATYDQYEAALVELGNAYDAGEINYAQFRVYLGELGEKESQLAYVSKTNRPDLPWGTERVRSPNSMQVIPAVEYQNNVEVPTDYTFAKNIHNGAKVSITVAVFDAARYRADGKQTNAPASSGNMYDVAWTFTQFANQKNTDTNFWNLERKEYENSFPLMEWACSDAVKARSRVHAIVNALDIFQLGANKFGGNSDYDHLIADSYTDAKCDAVFAELIEDEPYSHIQPYAAYTIPLTEDDFQQFVRQFDSPSNDAVTPAMMEEITTDDSWAVRISKADGSFFADFTIYKISGGELTISGSFDENAETVIEMSEAAARSLYNDFAQERYYPELKTGFMKSMRSTFKNLGYLFKSGIKVTPITSVLKLDEFAQDWT